MLIDQTREGIRATQRADVLHSIFLIPDEAPRLGCIPRTNLERETIKVLVIKGERIRDSVQRKACYLASVVDRLRETRAASQRPKISDLPFLPYHSAQFGQARDDRMELAILRIAGNQPV